MARVYTIDANSLPDFDDWGWDDYWEVKDWINWHKVLVLQLGKDKANEKFIAEWKKQSTGANPLNNRQDSTFKKYAIDNGFYPDLFTEGERAVLGLILKPMKASKDVLDSTTAIVSNVAETAENASNVLKYLVPVTIIGAVVLIGFIFYKRTT